MRRWYAQYFSDTPCKDCGGKRLRPESRAVKVADEGLAELVGMNIEAAVAWFKALPKKLNKTQLQIATELIKEISQRLGFLDNVGLNYLTWNAARRRCRAARASASAWPARSAAA